MLVTGNSFVKALWKIEDLSAWTKPRCYSFKDILLANVDLLVYPVQKARFSKSEFQDSQLSIFTTRKLLSVWNRGMSVSDEFRQYVIGSIKYKAADNVIFSPMRETKCCTCRISTTNLVTEANYVYRRAPTDQSLSRSRDCHLLLAFIKWL